MEYKYLFFNDYSEGTHPKVLKMLQDSNLKQEAGYGLDSISQEAIQLIQEKIDNKNAGIHFVTGGTQANLTVLASLLKPYESIIAVEQSHIHVHEAGAIEATGHKINIVKSGNGKLSPSQVEEVLDVHTDEHMVKPKVVFISQATEIGSVYNKTELEELFKFCKQKDLYLYLDGARLGSAIASEESNMTLKDVAQCTDIFYIGGTKNGALLGEAIVIVNPELKESFRYYLKQRGALVAKGRVIGAQFAALFKNNLYLENARHANKMAKKLSEGIQQLGYDFLSDSTTNQIFPILPNSIIEKLSQIYGFYVWTKTDEQHSAIRLVTSWATPENAVTSFLEDLQ